MTHTNTSGTEDTLHRIRHSLAHVLAHALSDLYPGVRFGIGPVIEHGFYYDVQLPSPIHHEDLAAIEKRMKEILKEHLPFQEEHISLAKAKDLFSDQPYKLDLLEEFYPASQGTDQQVKTYKVGSFVDLCKGGHVENTKDIPHNAFALLKIAGAYWRGNENNQMLTRIYGLAFEHTKDLDEALVRIKEAKLRDHKKLGKELDLFTFSELVGPGLPLFTPKGTLVRQLLFEKLSALNKKYGMEQVTTPHIAKRKLYETSGHTQKFGDELIHVQSHYDEFVLKPVTCPHHTQIYASRPRSYKDLPVRYMEPAMQYRDEKPGEIGGLARVRSITVDDGHIFCTPDQIKEEVRNIAHIIEEFYSAMGIFKERRVSLSLRDPHAPEKYIGDEKGWKEAERMLKEISEELHLEAVPMEGEAALYGPKLDYLFKDSLDREWQLATIQIDFAMPERFGLEYISHTGSKERPVMIHRAILGSYERFMAILIEHSKGSFPVWLAPVQVQIVPVSDKHLSYAKDIHEKLIQEGIRADIDETPETMGKKIREAELQKIPHILVLGDREQNKASVNVRTRGIKETQDMTLSAFIQLISKETEN